MGKKATDSFLQSLISSLTLVRKACVCVCMCVFLSGIWKRLTFCLQWLHRKSLKTPELSSLIKILKFNYSWDSWLTIESLNRKSSELFIWESAIYHIPFRRSNITAVILGFLIAQLLEYACKFHTFMTQICCFKAVIQGLRSTFCRHFQHSQFTEASSCRINYMKTSSSRHMQQLNG